MRDTNSPSFPWIPDQGDGTYQNPILFADYSDPDVVRQGSDFYLVASSFNCTPGLPILHSRDLVNWTIINHALRNLPDPRYQDVQPGCGVWAPSIRFHDGKFWIFYPTPDEGIFVVTADDPAGEWSAPHLVQAGRGLIDPCPLWDDDGQAYLVFAYARSRAGIKDRLAVAPMAPDGSRLLDEARVVFMQPDLHPTLEGPKFLKKDNWYYILAPAGGVESGWQVALRSRNVYGPYEDQIVLAQGSTPINGPHQGALVDTPAGEWWFVHFQERQPYGRIVHLQPVRWEDDWPLMGIHHSGSTVGEPVEKFRKPTLPDSPVAIPQTSDEFAGHTLGLQWQWHANHQDDWASLSAREGWLRLFCQPAANSLALTPSLLLQKFPAPAFVVDTLLHFSPAQDGEMAGLVVTERRHAAVCLRQSGQGCQVVYFVDDHEQAAISITGWSIHLRVQVAEGGISTFGYAQTNDVFHSIGEPFQASEGVWIGAKVGLFALNPGLPGPSGHGDIDYFRFSNE